MTGTPIHFQKPPIVEVALGILFQPIHNLMAPHLGLLWHKWKAEFSQFGEAPPLPPSIELQQAGASPEIQVSLSALPPLRRTWFLGTDGQKLIQVQRDRFIYNWRKDSEKSTYPEFTATFKEYCGRFDEFLSFLAEQNLGPLQPLQYEMTYVDHILTDLGPGAESAIDLCRHILPRISWQRQNASTLADPVGFESRLVFDLPQGTGRVHVSIQSASRADTGQPLIIMESVARGAAGPPAPETMKSWFETAHESLIDVFTGLTSNDAQTSLWERTQ